MILTFILLVMFLHGPVCLVDTVPVVQVDTLTVPKTMETKEIVENEPLDVSPKISHLAFKGISLDEGVVPFGYSLEKQGFHRVSSHKFSGVFAGVEETTVLLAESCGNVWKVTVIFPFRMGWFQAKDEYLKFKNWFGWKYVITPTLVREKLSSRFKEGSGQEAWGFENGSSVFESVFDLEEGRVILYIAFDKLSGGLNVCIDYIDRINSLYKEEYEMLDL